jgi:peptide/nickel transport system permease protein
VHALTRLVLSRLAQGALLLLALSFALFAVLAHLPGDAGDVVATDPTLGTEERARQRSLRGLDQPFFVQWWRWLVGHEQPVASPPILEAVAVVGRLGPDPDPRRAAVFLLDVPAPPAPAGTRLQPIPPLTDDGGRWRAALHEPGATRVYARIEGLDERFAGQEGLWSMPVFVAPAVEGAGEHPAADGALDSADAEKAQTRWRAAAEAVRPLAPVARVTIPRLQGQHVAADDGDVYIVDGAVLVSRFACGALCFLLGDRAALGWSWATQRPVAELLLGPDERVCGDGLTDPGEGCDDGNKNDDDRCSATCMPPGATVLDRIDVAVAGILVTRGRVGNTLWLTVPALLGSLLVALALGTWSARRGGRVDVVVRVVSAASGGAPTYVIALALLAVVAVGWRVLPTGGLFTPGIHEAGAWATLVDRLRHGVLPTLVLALVWTGRFVRPVHAAVVAVQDADFVVAAQARGLSSSSIFARHILPHAAVPLVTLAGVSLPSLVGGALLTETLFAWPGMGRLQYDSLVSGDAYVAVVVLLAHAVFVIAGALLADVVLWLLDPRTRTPKSPRRRREAALVGQARGQAPGQVPGQARGRA